MELIDIIVHDYPIIWSLMKAIMVIIPVVLAVAYLTLAERKILGYMHVRLGPNRVGVFAVLQPFADLLKMIFKEWVIPSAGNKILFIMAPFITVMAAFSVWAVVPFGDTLIASTLDSGILFIMAMASIGMYASLIGGWASNSKFATFGAIRSAAQVISYELAMGFALITVVMCSGTLTLTGIVDGQRSNMGLVGWYFVPLFPVMVIYFISALAELGRAPFAVVEGESEIIAGFFTEYSGTGFVTFYLAEYTNVILVAALSTLLFFGGWLSPFGGVALFQEGGALSALGFLATDHLLWMIVKMAFFLFFIIWIRATFPQYRYDQIMRLGWKFFIPIAIAWILVVIALGYFKVGPWFA